MWIDPKDRVYTNEYIRGDKILLLWDDWEKLWTFSKEEALEMAYSKNEDLIQVWYNPNDRIVIAKIMELWKYMYEKKKDDSEKRKSQKAKVMKEVKFSYNIWDNDLNMKLEKAKDFLKNWHPVKFIWQLRWRENIYAKKLYDRLKSIEQDMETISKSQWIKAEKKWYSMILFAKVK